MYAEHFGFSKLPFSVTPDPQVFFDNSVYREAFAKLQHGVLAKKGLVLITGEVGTGKTTLLRKLLYGLGPTAHSVFISNPQVSFVELLRFILDDLNLACEHSDKRTMIETLDQYLIERSRQGHIVILLIDEAQNLCDEALEGLRLLSNLKTDTEKLLQIVLMGQPELEVRLNHPKLRPLKQRITIQCRLAPLKKEEVGAYIEFRLKAVGFRGQSPFQRDSLEAIAFYSKGIPRLVNI
ncbi:MAG TPA: AAA family ATPase, partial [Candidatus Binatia bacterium]